MIRSSKLLLSILVLLPVALLAWGGMRLAALDQQKIEQNIEQLLRQQLVEIDRSIQGQFEVLSDEMTTLTTIDDYEASRLREIARNDPRVYQAFVIDPDDRIFYPSPVGSLTRIERDFLLKAADLVNDRRLQLSEATSAEKSSSPTKKQSSQLKRFGKAEALAAEGHWYVWYWGPGMHLIHWQRRPNGYIVGVALERSRWIADVIAKLPDTGLVLDEGRTFDFRTQIVESGNTDIYKWGAYDPGKSETPTAELRLSTPLSAWQLQMYVPLEILAAGQSGNTSLWVGISLSTVALICLAIFIARQHGHELQEAQRRVSFVNQVSHELRTPLTNIRMYAELLEKDLSTLELEEEKPLRRLDVILNESQRLTRLIGNVLTFARREKQSLELRPNEININELIRNVVHSFQPTLDQREIAVHADLQTPDSVSVDPDVVEQILINLIGNVEKYAAEGKWIQISSRVDGDLVIITVADHGPGIEMKNREKIFTPFWRASNEINKTAGTGIGLTIVRTLAQLHGGDAVLLPSEVGAEFQITLRACSVEGENT